MEDKKSFMARLEGRLTPSEYTLVRGAYYLSKYGHRGQFRKELDEGGQPLRYFEHPRRVALILMDEVRCYDPNTICGGLLHDCFEDSEDIDPVLVELFLNGEVCKLVMNVSKFEGEDYLDKLLTADDFRVLLVKICDRTDNLRSLPGTSEEFQAKQLAETEKYIRAWYPKIDNKNAHLFEAFHLLRDAYHKAGGASL